MEETPQPKTTEGESARSLLEEMLADEERARKLVEGSCMSGDEATTAELWEAWQEQRKFIADAINKPGTVLDFGCANGLLLACLQRWSPHALTPYGLDTDEEAIAAARLLFPQQTTHFLTPVEYERGEEFPKQFDFVYWNVWDNYEFDAPKALDRLGRFIELTAPEGRMILGFYDTEEKNQRKIDSLTTAFKAPSQVKKNPHGDEYVAWFQK